MAVVVVDQDDLGPTRQPGVWGGTATITIPVLTVGYDIGTNLLAKGTTDANSPLVLRVGDDESVNLGQYQGGKGSSDILFGITVPKAGVYPLRLVWENGGGDANCEWFLQNPTTGAKTLINDTGSTVKAFRSRTVSQQPVMDAKLGADGSVTISWTGSGKLQSRSSLTSGSWADVPNVTGNSYKIQSPAGNAFYQIAP